MVDTTKPAHPQESGVVPAFRASAFAAFLQQTIELLINQSYSNRMVFQEFDLIIRAYGFH
jgi:hypothetical protein